MLSEVQTGPTMLASNATGRNKSHVGVVWLGKRSCKQDPGDERRREANSDELVMGLVDVRNKTNAGESAIN